MGATATAAGGLGCSRRTAVRYYNEERQRLAASSTSTRTKLEGKRDRIESERQRNIDLVVKQVIEGDDARGRIAELKAQRLQVEVELAALEEAQD